MTTDDEIMRGREAERLMSDPLLVEAFSAVEKAILDGLRTVDVGAKDAQRDLIVTLQLLGNLQRILKTHIQTGELAQIAKQESLGKRILRRMA